MSTDAPYTISDLAGLTGLSVRTIRYYLAQGLIPASGESGPGAHYTDAHLGRLRLVRRLQQQHLPLAEIRSRLAALRDEEVVALAAQTAEPAPAPETSALEYVRSVLAGSPAPSPASGAPMAAMQARVASPAAKAAPAFDMSTSIPAAPGTPNPLLRQMTSRLAEAPASDEPELDAQPPSIERSQWERLSLGPDLELHVRRPLGRLAQKRVERLITIARQVLKEEQP